jgi:phosphatidylserine/phosphatidylglycerophosphate/cardiolipin synthase-like enzyme
MPSPRSTEPAQPIQTIPNLHAKVVVVDDWALVGSGNLTRSGTDHLNVELGLVSRGDDAAGVVDAFEAWWRHASRSAGAGHAGRRAARSAYRAGHTSAAARCT